ncbi:MFS transporter [Caldimonas tepidiphila]|uniref:MFS transporter n=1 Tax=Caldimonas tepidiphila TaxID=2315841 RepID=UPI001300300B|nr:MFS transporter [Caldimonas tepidiphila]
MNTTTESWSGRAVLLLAHVAGMIDLVALPIWVGAALIGQYGFSPTQAGSMVTAFLAAAVCASLFFAPRFHRHPAHRAAPVGYAIAAIAFALLTQVSHAGAMTALHALAGFGAGMGLSFTHGAIGRSGRPQRLFAIVTLGLGVSAIFFLGVAQGLVPRLGGPVLFMLFAALMAITTLATAVAFPRPAASEADCPASERPAEPVSQPIAAPLWWGIAGLTLMAITQSTVFSFVERIGVARGFGGQVLGVLIALGFVNLAAPVLAALLERRLKAMPVAMGGAALQLTLALVIAFSAGFTPYAAAASVFVAVMIFTHTFVFGWLSRHDASGRAVALTPAMLMSGAALGPVAGGALYGSLGTHGIGVAALFIGASAFGCYLRAFHLSRTLPAPAAAVATVPSH